MTKHIEVRHKNSKICWYWQEGECANIYCRFEHPPRPTQKTHNATIKKDAEELTASIYILEEATTTQEEPSDIKNSAKTEAVLLNIF